MKHTAEGLRFITNKLPVNWCLLILYPQAKSSVLRELAIWRRSNETWGFSEQRTGGKIRYLRISISIWFFLQLLISDISSFIQSPKFSQFNVKGNNKCIWCIKDWTGKLSKLYMKSHSTWFDGSNLTKKAFQEDVHRDQDPTEEEWHEEVKQVKCGIFLVLFYHNETHCMITSNHKLRTL